MVEQCLSRLPEALHGVDVTVPQDVLNAMPGPLSAAWRRRAAAAAERPLTVIRATDWLRYTRDGDRAVYESLYFPRRRRLVDLVCGSLTGEAHMDAILDTVWAICEESAWQVPAHNVYIRDTPSLKWPDTSRPVVDLFAAETGALLACTRAVLGEALDAEVAARMFREVESRVVTPYLTSHFWWMGNGGEPMCNWTPWCTQNVLLCAFTLPFSVDVRRAVVRQAAVSLDCFLKDYGDDGCCSEGAQYYSHAALCLFGCLELLCEAAPGAFDSLWAEPKIRAMAAYIFHMHIDGPYYVNFADCSPFAGRRGAREYLFALRTGNEGMARFAASDWVAGGDEPDADSDVARINLWYQLLEAKAAPAMARATGGADAHAPDAYYPSVGVLTARRGAWFLAAKAGCNGDSHNHNDTGSVTLYRAGKPVLIDLGVETYSRKTFSPQRYEIWTMQSAWHNLPTFGGVMQSDGASFRARDVETRLTPDEACMNMELAGAWPEAAKLDSFVRAVRLTAAGLTIEDECRGAYADAFLSLMTCEKPEPSDGGYVLGALAHLTISGACAAPEVDAVPVTDARLRLAWPETVYRIRIPFRNALTISVQ